MEGLCRVLRSPGGNTGGVSNPGVAVSAMNEANLQGVMVEEQRGLGGNIISSLDNGSFVGLIYSLLISLGSTWK